jgi:hypothetical protein
MDFIEFSLRRLYENASHFITPSAALQDVPTLKAQIELRRLVLRDIEVIRCRLRPFMRCRKSRRRRGGRSRIGHPRRRYSRSTNQPAVIMT